MDECIQESDLLPHNNINYVIIVARYHEDITWTKQFANVVIYNKGDKLDGYNEIILPNIGRESHTYYKYIYDNYDNLADYSIFLQGYPFDHSPNIILNLNNYINNTELNIDFEFLSEHIIDCNLTGCRYHPGLYLIDIYEKIFNEKKYDMNFQFGAGAHFIVSKKNILKRPKEFYLNIINIIQDDYLNTSIGYVIERFHKLILG
uniref:Uncharacterized protein n=1 Tax=viral metagenome TaxID=1070528 RepID=A0A6C0H808_9ZZZZ